MKNLLRIPLIIYQLLVFYPLLILLTALTALSTIILSYLTTKRTVHAIPATLWSHAMCAIAFVRVRVEGLERLDPKQSYIVTANHQSWFDIWVIYGWLGRPFSWIMKQELRKVPLLGLACERIGHIFIDRSNPVEARKSIEKAEKTLRGGHCVVIFPEGTRSKNGKVGIFKRGAFSMASDLLLPVAPISISGAYRVMSRKAWWVTPGTITMQIHEPVPCDHKLQDSEIRAFANQIREIIVSGIKHN
ncbi:MAG: 1-acyl-sn-glycerol-3-phosphate acyltransferase [Prevotellaceae bacterium]|nr:1-acyl-sn-glycerol-3-phosphate acyltransferase [Prevotellaceae bacterium]